MQIKNKVPSKDREVSNLEPKRDPYYKTLNWWLIHVVLLISVFSPKEQCIQYVLSIIVAAIIAWRGHIAILHSLPVEFTFTEEDWIEGNFYFYISATDHKKGSRPSLHMQIVNDKALYVTVIPKQSNHDTQAQKHQASYIS